MITARKKQMEGKGVIGSRQAPGLGKQYYDDMEGTAAPILAGLDY